MKWWFRDVSGFGSLPVQAIPIVDVVHREGRRRLGLLSSFWCHARILLIEDGTEASELVREDSS